MAELADMFPKDAAYAYTGLENIRNDIYPAISVQQTPSLAQPGKVVLITGAGRGIGRAIALQYAYAGVASIILCARTASQLDEVEASIKKIKADIRVHKYALDVTSEEGVKKCAAEIKEKEGRLDILVNNAGASSRWSLMAESDPSDWWNCLTINLYGPYLFIQSFLPLLVSTAEEQKAANIINVSSIASVVVMPNMSAYQISKAALNRLSEFVVAEYGDKGVNCVAVHPGGVDTELSRQEASIKPFMIDTPELCGGWAVWMTKEARTWLSGRYASATWDVEKLESMKEDIVKEDKLRLKLVV